MLQNDHVLQWLCDSEGVKMKEEQVRQGLANIKLLGDELSASKMRMSDFAPLDEETAEKVKIYADKYLLEQSEIVRNSYLYALVAKIGFNRTKLELEKIFQNHPNYRKENLNYALLQQAYERAHA